MRSPLGARFPSHSAALLSLILFAACTSGGDGPGEAEGRPTSAAPVRTPQATAEGTDPGRAAAGEDDSVVFIDEDSKRTVRGTAPPYVEIQSAEVAGSVDELSLRMTLSGPLPARMPNEHSVLRVSFMLTLQDGSKFTFDAQCVRAGWGAFASGGPEDAPPPDLTMSDHGGTVAIGVDPAYIGGLQPFEWIASVAWTSGRANYAFDSAPKSGLASFP